VDGTSRNPRGAEIGYSIIVQLDARLTRFPPLAVQELRHIERLAALVPVQGAISVASTACARPTPNAKRHAEIIPDAPVNANDNLANHGDAPHPSAPTALEDPP